MNCLGSDLLLLGLPEGGEDGLPVVLAPVVPAAADGGLVVLADEGGEVVLGLGAQGVDLAAALEESGDHGLLAAPVGGGDGLDLADELLAAVVHVDVEDGHEVGVDELESHELGGGLLGFLGLTLVTPVVEAEPAAAAADQGSLNHGGAQKTQTGGGDPGAGEEDGAGSGGEGEASGGRADGQTAAEDGGGGGGQTGHEEGGEDHGVHLGFGFSWGLNTRTPTNKFGSKK